jgi:type II secretory pathway pseudopilin PulG
MKEIFKGIGILVSVILLGFLLYLGLGYLGVIGTKTVGKAQQNAQREVFENTQSYVEGKRQEALKYYKEYKNAPDDESRKAIKALVSQSFANFDENKLSPTLKNFVYTCKYN